MKYLDANVLFSMFAVTKRRQQEFRGTRTSGNAIIDYCLKLLEELDSNKRVVIVSDLAVLETLGVASRDAGPEKARLILQAINKQQGIEVIQTSQLTWAVAKAITVISSIEGRDSLHLANSLLTEVVTTIVTCDRDFTSKSKLFLEEKANDFKIPEELQNWYRISQEDANDLYRLIRSRSNIGIELLELTK